MSDTDVATISPLYRELLAEGFEKASNAWVIDKIENLLRILTKRLGEVPPTVGDKLHTIRDLDRLGQLTDLAWDCRTIDEFVKVLEK